jgi:ribosomal protein S18 acetylase RimI-like enzyme
VNDALALGAIVAPEARAIDPMRIEEAGLNGVQTPRQLFYDGWLLRLSPGKAKRGRSVNAHFGSTLPLDDKIARCEKIYAACELPALFRITPFSQPRELAAALERRGYIAFDPTLVQAVDLRRMPTSGEQRTDFSVMTASVAQFVEAIGDIRESSRRQRDAHRERLQATPLAMHALVIEHEGRFIACGQAAIDDDIAGIYDMATDEQFRGQGLARTIVGALLDWAQQHGATKAFLQVNADNEAALAVYRRYGFQTVYTYDYRARAGECH